MHLSLTNTENPAARKFIIRFFMVQSYHVIGLKTSSFWVTFILSPVCIDYSNVNISLYALTLFQLGRDNFYHVTKPKGQIISKGRFGVLEFSQKTNERICRSSKNEFVRSFFGRIRGYQKSFEII